MMYISLITENSLRGSPLQSNLEQSNKFTNHRQRNICQRRFLSSVLHFNTKTIHNTQILGQSTQSNPFHRHAYNDTKETFLENKRLIFLSSYSSQARISNSLKKAQSTSLLFHHKPSHPHSLKPQSQTHSIKKPASLLPDKISQLPASFLLSPTQHHPKEIKGGKKEDKHLEHHPCLNQIHLDIKLQHYFSVSTSSFLPQSPNKMEKGNTKMAPNFPPSHSSLLQKTRSLFLTRPYLTNEIYAKEVKLV